MKKYQLLFMKNLLHIKIEIQFITETVRLNLKKLNSFTEPIIVGITTKYHSFFDVSYF